MDELKKFREGKSMTQRQMASKIGVSLSYYRKIEQGKNKPSYQFMKKLKDVFPKVSVDKLFFRSK